MNKLSRLQDAMIALLEEGNSLRDDLRKLQSDMQERADYWTGFRRPPEAGYELHAFATRLDCLLRRNTVNPCTDADWETALQSFD